MKCLQFNFSHPVKGHALLTRISADQSADTHTFRFDSEDSNELIISLEGVTDGKWKVILEWEYEEKYFTHSSEFDLPSEICCSLRLCLPMPAYSIARGRFFPAGENTPLRIASNAANQVK